MNIIQAREIIDQVRQTQEVSQKNFKQIKEALELALITSRPDCLIHTIKGDYGDRTDNIIMRTETVDIFLGLYDLNNDGVEHFICFVNSPFIKDPAINYVDVTFDALVIAINEQNLMSEEILNNKKEKNQIRKNLKPNLVALQKQIKTIALSVQNNTEIKINSKNLYQLSFKDLSEEQIKRILAKVEEI